MAPTRSTPPKNATAKDYQQLWKSVTGATDAVGAVRALAKIVVDSDGRAFVSELETKDAVLCIEALDYVSLRSVFILPFAASDGLVRASQN